MSSMAGRTVRTAVAFLGITCMLVVLAPPAVSSSKRPDLIVASVSNAAAKLLPGDSFKVTDTVKNNGSAKAGGSTARYYLSLDSTKGSTDLLAGTRKVPSLGPGASSKKTATLTVPDPTPLGSYSLIACADDLKKVKESKEDNNCRVSSNKISVAETSFALIDDAVARGEITAEQGQVYTAFAEFSDPRLPLQYRGADSGQGDSGRIAGVAGAIGSFSSSDMAAVAPFFMPPAYQGSWIDQYEMSSSSRRSAKAAAAQTTCVDPDPDLFVKTIWMCQDTEHFRIWHNPDLPESATIANALASEVENVYAKETTLFGRVPLSDANLPVLTDDQGRKYKFGGGGDGRIDVYVTEVGLRYYYQRFRGLTVAYPVGCKQRPAFTIINTEFVHTAQQARDVFAHEFFHQIEFTYDLAASCNLYDWLGEATGTWAIDYVYPDDNYEHEFVKPYLHCDFLSPIDSRYARRGGYEDYLLPFFLARSLDPTVVRDIWDETELFNDLESVDQGVPGGLAKWWPRFAMANWNHPGTDQYKSWDGIQDQLEDSAGGACHHHYTLGLGGAAEHVLKLNDDRIYVESTTSKYQVFDFPDDHVRRITFVNPFFEEQNATAAGIWAWYKLADGTTFVEDWSQQPKMTWCRDRPEQDIQQLMVMYSYGDPSARDRPQSVVNVTLNGQVVARADCLPNTFAGSFSGVEQDTNPPGDRGPTLSWNGTATWKRVSSNCVEYWCLEPGYQGYVLQGGAVDWQISGGDAGGCSASGNGSFQLSPGSETDNNANHLTVQRRPASGHGRRHYGILGQEEFLDVTLNCPDGSFPGQLGGDLWWAVTPNDNKEGDPSSDVLQGTVQHGPSNQNPIQENYTWSFAPAD